jgi:hypothetical protein
MVKSAWIFAVFIAVLLGRPSMAENNQPSTNATPAQHQQRTKKIVPPPGAVVDPRNTTPRGKSEPTNQESDPPEKPLPRFLRPEWVIVYITAIYSLIAGLTLWVIKRQADTMELQAKDARKASADSAKTTQETLAAIKEQAQAMRDQANLMVDHKLVLIESMKAARQSADAAKTGADIATGVSVPTLVVHELGVGNVGAVNVEAFFQYPKIKITIKNYGQTPAFLKWWSLRFSCEDLPEAPIYDGPGDGMILDKIVVQPGATCTLPELFYPHRQEFSMEDVKAIVNREKTFCMYGYICYGDIFGNPLRRLKFCETVLNIFGDEAICDWWEGFAPFAYTGTDQLPTKQPRQEKPEKANQDTTAPRAAGGSRNRRDFTELLPTNAV